MIDGTKYIELRKKINRFDAWVDSQRNPRSGWASYREQDIPRGLPVPSNEERSQVEVYEFCRNRPDKYFIYVQRNKCAPGVYDNKFTATTWTGQALGYGFLGRRYTTGAGLRVSVRYPVRFTAITGDQYHGTYYASAGDYARVKKVV
jgi:hypothetical protein